jgi:hypothetical protein
LWSGSNNGETFSGSERRSSNNNAVEFHLCTQQLCDCINLATDSHSRTVIVCAWIELQSWFDFRICVLDSRPNPCFFSARADKYWSNSGRGSWRPYCHLIDHFWDHNIRRKRGVEGKAMSPSHHSVQRRDGPSGVQKTYHWDSSHGPIEMYSEHHISIEPVELPGQAQYTDHLKETR